MGHFRATGQSLIDRRCLRFVAVGPHVVDQGSDTIVSTGRLADPECIGSPGPGDQTAQGLPALSTHCSSRGSMEGAVVPEKLQVIGRAVAGTAQHIDQDAVLSALLGGDALLDPVHTAGGRIVEFENPAAVFGACPLSKDPREKALSPDFNPVGIGPARNRRDKAQAVLVPEPATDRCIVEGTAGEEIIANIEIVGLDHHVAAAGRRDFEVQLGRDRRAARE